MNLISRLINRSGLRISHFKVFSSDLLSGYSSFRDNKKKHENLDNIHELDPFDNRTDPLNHIP